MSEEEILNIVREITQDDLLNCWEGGDKEFEAIQGLLDLYQQEKEENKKLRNCHLKYEEITGIDLLLEE